MPVMATRSVWLLPSFCSTAAKTVNCCLVRSPAPCACENRSFAYCTQRRSRCDGEWDRSKLPSPLRGLFEAIAQPPGRFVEIYLRRIVRTRRTTHIINGFDCERNPFVARIFKLMRDGHSRCARGQM